MTHYRKCFCNPTLPGTEWKASLSILRILSIQWCALSPFICAIFRGSGEWSDERGATKAFPSREANQRQLLLFFFHPGFVFFPLAFHPFLVISGFLKTPPSCAKASFSTVWNHFIMLVMWILRGTVSPCHQDTQPTTTVVLSQVQLRIQVQNLSARVT